MGTNYKYDRVLLKLSGEALMGTQSYGIDVAMTDRIAKEVADAHSHHRRRRERPVGRVEGGARFDALRGQTARWVRCGLHHTQQQRGNNSDRV